MLTKDNFPQALRADLDVAYSEGLDSFNDTDYLQLVQVEPTTSSAKIKVFYGNKPRMNRFRGERQPKKFNEYKATMTLDTWESTTTVDRTVLDDDQSGGLLRRKIVEFGEVVQREKKQGTEEFLRNGVSQISFDKTPFFNPAHVYTATDGSTYGPVWGNVNWGGSQLDPTTLQLDEAFFASLPGDDSEVLGMRLTHVGVRRGSANDKSAKELNNSTYTVEQNTFKDNVYRGSFNIIRFDYGFGASEWASFDLSSPEMKPVVVLSHTISPGWDSMEFTQMLQDSDTGFWRNEFAFGVMGRFDWNPGDPRTAYLHGSSAYSPTVADLERQRVLAANAL